MTFKCFFSNTKAQFWLTYSLINCKLPRRPNREKKKRPKNASPTIAILKAVSSPQYQLVVVIVLFIISCSISSSQMCCHN